MTPEATLYANSTAPLFAGGMMALFILIAIRDAIRKAIALRKAGRGNQLARFVCLFIFNTAGILPILYLIFRQKKDIKKEVSISKTPVKTVKKVIKKKSPAKKTIKK